MIPLLSGLREIAPAYDGFIVDLWGVLHDGTSAYPGAAETLARLGAAGKRVVLLSNAPRRAAGLEAQMAAMGIGHDLYFALMSSGEAVHQALARRDDSAFAALGRRFHHLGPDFDDSVFAGLGLEKVDPDRAEFILNTGPWQPWEMVEYYQPLLRDAVTRDLPMICANPDREVIRDGRRAVCAGAVAERYQALGGRVLWRGKPDPAIYAQVLTLLDVPPSRVLCIGDAMPTDIQGAHQAGLASLLITRGIHAAELGTPPAPAAIAALAERFGLAPRAALAEFVW